MSYRKNITVERMHLDFFALLRKRSGLKNFSGRSTIYKERFVPAGMTFNNFSAWERGEVKQVSKEKWRAMTLCFMAAAQDPRLAVDEQLLRDLKRLETLSGMYTARTFRSPLSKAYLPVELTENHLQHILSGNKKSILRADLNALQASYCAEACHNSDEFEDTIDYRGFFERQVFTLSPRECHSLVQEYEETTDLEFGSSFRCHKAQEIRLASDGFAAEETPPSDIKLTEITREVSKVSFQLIERIMAPTVDVKVHGLGVLKCVND